MFFQNRPLDKDLRTKILLEKCKEYWEVQNDTEKGSDTEKGRKAANKRGTIKPATTEDD